MKQYLFTNEAPHSQRWSVSMIHATPFRTKENAEAAIVKFAITGAAGCQEFHDYWYVFRESNNKVSRSELDPQQKQAARRLTGSSFPAAEVR